MNRTFTSKTYGDVRYVVEDGNYLYFPKDVVYGLGRDGVTFGGRDMADIRKAGLYREATFGNRKKPQWALDLEGVKFFRDRKLPKKKKERAAAFFEWLQAQEESARNGAPCIPAPAKKEQPTEQGDFLPDFHSYITRLTRKRDECQRTINICESVFMQAAAWKKGWDDISAKYAEQKAQVAELKQQLADNDITDTINNITKLRYMLGDSELKRYADDYMFKHKDVLRYQDTYTPTQMADFVKNMSKFSMHLSAQVVNRKLEEAGYQERCDSNEEGAYKLTSLIDESYAYKTFIKGNNDFVLPSLVWTKKGLALLIGLLLDTELIEGTCI